MPYSFILAIEKAICVVRHFRIFSLDRLIGLGVVAVEIMVPADGRGVDEPLDDVGMLLHEFAAGFDQGRIGRVAVIGEQEDVGLEAALFFDLERLGGQIPLLDRMSCSTMNGAELKLYGLMFSSLKP